MSKRERSRTSLEPPSHIHTQLLLDIGEQVLCEGLFLRFRARGGSMHPTICHGDVVTVAPVDPGGVKVGDIVLCRSSGRALVHRVVGVMGGGGPPLGFILKGDASPACDEPIQAGDVLGKVVSVDRRGSALGRRARRAGLIIHRAVRRAILWRGRGGWMPEHHLHPEWRVFSRGECMRGGKFALWGEEAKPDSA